MLLCLPCAVDQPRNVPKLDELRVGVRHVVGLHERLEGDLPVAVEDQPVAPPVAHVLELEGVEQGGRGLEVVAQRLAVRVHVDPDPAAPGVDLDVREAGRSRRSGRRPVLPLAAHRCSCRRGRSAIRGSRRRTASAAAAGFARARPGCRRAGGPGASRRCGRRGSSSGAGAHDDDRVVEDLVGEEVADLGESPRRGRPVATPWPTACRPRRGRIRGRCTPPHRS